MADETNPRPEAPDLLTPELAPTELAGTQSGPHAAAPRHAERQPRVVGRFRIDGQLGSGGMGDVFRAYDTVLDRAVALKVLRTDRSADGAQRMRRVIREARAAAALVHPNAVTVFDVGEADDEVFIAMELLEGEDLRFVLERGDASLDDKLRWLLEAARALAAAHERGLVHRDVKPENMFVCKGGTLKLLDFGIAKRDDDDAAPVDDAALSVGPSSLRTTEGRRVGTPRYMAPEQHAGHATDGRTDEFAWGLVASELLTGAHVAPDLRTRTNDGAGEQDARSTEERLEALRAKAPGVPEGVARAIARALEPRKEDRFPSMADVVAALEKKADPVALVPAPRPRRARPVAIATGMAAVLAIAGGALYAHRNGDAAHPAPGGAPACRVDATRTFTLAKDDRFTIVPSGAAIVARNIRRGLVLDPNGLDGGADTFMQPAFFEALGNHYEDVDLRGVSFGGQPALLLEIFQRERGAALTLLVEKRVWSSRRVPPFLSEVVAAPFGKSVVAVTVTTDLLRNPHGHNLVEAYLLGSTPSGPAVVEEGLAAAPAIDAHGDRVAVTYVMNGEVHLAILDQNLQRLGDVLKVAPVDARPAVAFAGDTAAVFWTDTRAGKTRLTSSTFTPGARAVTAPVVAVDEPLSPRPPVTARLPDGRAAVAWVASAGAQSTLRIALLGAAGALTGPTDLAKAATIDGLQVTPTDHGVEFWWFETESTVRVASVTCAAPPD